MAAKNRPKPKKTNKHKIPGKHKLKYDSIFKGKKYEPLREDEPPENHKEGFEIETGTMDWYEKIHHEDYERLKVLRKQIYELVLEKTQVNLKSNRRKPGRVDFNRYYAMLVENIDLTKFSYSEVFSEFSTYFSENSANVFKLLDPKWAEIIINELATKYQIKKVDKFDFL